MTNQERKLFANLMKESGFAIISLPPDTSKLVEQIWAQCGEFFSQSMEIKNSCKILPYSIFL